MSLNDKALINIIPGYYFLLCVNQYNDNYLISLLVVVVTKGGVWLSRFLFPSLHLYQARCVNLPYSIMMAHLLITLFLSTQAYTHQPHWPCPFPHILINLLLYSFFPYTMPQAQNVFMQCSIFWSTETLVLNQATRGEFTQEW